MNITDYDRFLEELEQKLRNSPQDQMKILSEAIRQTECPYLLSKLSTLRHIYKLSVLVVACFMSFLASAQVHVTITNADKGEPLQGATVAVQSLATGYGTIGVSNQNGLVVFDQALPVMIRVSHVGYETYTDTLFRDSHLAVALTSSHLQLNDVVVTGQFQAQSIDASVFSVKTIDQQRIATQASIDLADVLTNDLNIGVSPDKSTGRTSVSMMGLDGQYVKILVDGIPFVSAEGNGNNVDITQINLNNIERIEIVQSPMAVNYGANAVAGVINLITRKVPTNKVSLQEESVGKEYDLHAGRHIQSISLGHVLWNKLTVQTNFRRNDFDGFRDGFKGEDYTKNDGLRGYSWFPKIQNSGDISASLNWNNHRVSYKFGLFAQRLFLYSSTVYPDENAATGLDNPYAFDTEVTNNRFTHSLLNTGKFGHVHYDIASSYSGVQMVQREYRYRILSGKDESTVSRDTSLLKTAMSRGNFTNFIRDQSYDFQVGYEYTYEQIESASVDEGKKDLHNLAGFLSTEWSPLQALTLRPGLRVIYNTLYPSPLIYSMSAKYTFSNKLDTRLSYSRSYRTPNLTELYYYFVDSNHDVQGNPDLKPEDGHSLSLDLKMPVHLGSTQYTPSLQVFYNDIRDQITLSVISTSPLKYRYINVDRYKTRGITFSNAFQLGDLMANAGVSVMGRYSKFDETDLTDKFLYSVQANLNLTYLIRPLNLTVATYFKHTGKVLQYVQSSTDDDYYRGATDPYNWLDLTFTWSPVSAISVSTGAKNIFDVTNVTTSAVAASAHSEAPTSTGISYGRSYFVRLVYDFGDLFSKQPNNKPTNK